MSFTTKFLWMVAAIVLLLYLMNLLFPPPAPSKPVKPAGVQGIYR